MNLTPHIADGKVNLISLKTLAETETAGSIERCIRQIISLQERLNLSQWTAEDFLAETSNPNAVILVAVFDNKIIAFLMVRLTYAEENSSRQYEEADLLNFGVSKSFQQKGIGSGLFAKLIEILRDQNVSALWLEVRESNSKAVAFYLKRRFKFIQNRRNFYSNPVENGLVMKLELTAEKSYENSFEEFSRLD